MSESKVWRPFTPASTPPALKVVAAHGAYLHLADGRKVLDGTSSWWVQSHGHCHPAVVKAVAAQTHALTQTLFADFTHPMAEELAERLTAMTGMHRAFYSDDGSTAVEVALKIALQHAAATRPGAVRVAALDGAYHGDAFGAMSVSARTEFSRPFERLLFDVDFLPFDDPVPAAEVLFSRQTVAALIVEPLIQATGGMRFYSPETLSRLTGVARNHGVSVIFDEVMTGFGRTGKTFAYQWTDVKPDVLCLSKALTAGIVPMGLTLADERMFEPFAGEETLWHGHSYTGNAVACAAAVASLDLFEKPETWEAINAIVAAQRAGAEALRNAGALNARANGVILAFEAPNDGPAGYFNQIKHKIKRFCLERGLAIRPLGNTVYFFPPYCTTTQDVARAHEILADGLHSGWN
jgi:adenosylmethionine-8-amino-7-oxononanoate aminotransferase